MKRKLFSNKLWLRVGMLVAIMTTALSGTAWADTVVTLENIGAELGSTPNTTAATTSITATGTTDSYTLNYYQCKKQGSAMLMTKNESPYISNKTAMPGNIKSVKVFINSGASGKATYDCAFSTTELNTATSGVGAQNITGGNSHVFTNTTVEGKYFCITLGNANNGQVLKLVITCEDAGGSTLTANDLTLNATEKEFDLADGAGQTFQLTNSGVADGALSFESSNNAVATVSSTGLITAVGEGTATITVTQAASETYAGGTAPCTVTVTDSRYTISNLTFTDKCNGSGTADDNVAWTVASDGTESAFDNTKGIHYGTGSAAVQYITLTTSGINGTIKKIVVNASTANDVSATASVTVGGAAFGGEAQSLTSSAADYTFTGSASGEIVVTVTKPESATKALYVKSIKVYYIPSTDPYITAEDVTIAYDETSGSIGYSLTNATGNVTATVTDGDWLTLGAITSSTVPFTCTTNSSSTARTAIVTLSFSGAEDKVVTVTQTRDPNALMTIAEARAQGTGNVHTKGIVTSSVGTTAYIQDANAAICVYGESLTVGDEIEVSGTLTDFHGLLEITEPTVTVLSQENTVTPEVLTIAQVKASTKQGWLVKIENATVTEVGSSNNYTIAQGDETITLHGALGDVAVNDVITFTGNIGYYNSVQLVNPTDVTVTGTVTPTTYTITWEESANNTEIFVYDAADENTSLTSPASVAANTTINVSVSAASGFTLDALTIKDAGNNDITYSEIGEGYYQFTMPASNVTITATAVASSVTPTAGATVTYDFSSTDNFLTTYPGSTNPETGNSHNLETFYYTNGDEFAATGTSHYFNASGYFMLGKSGATLTLPAFPFNVSKISITGASAASEKVEQNIYVDDDAVSTATTGAKNVTNEYEIAANKQAAGTIYTLKVTNAYNTQITKIEVFGYESVTVSSAGYATYCSENALDFTGTDITAYVGTIEGTHLTFTPITQVPANTGLLLKATTAGSATTVNVPVIASAPALTNPNCLTGTNEAITLDKDDYILNVVNGKAGFYRATTQYTALAAHRAYISAEAGQGVKSFFIDLDDDATAIGTVESFTEEGAIYNVAGQRLQKMQKGINIVNGKKILY